MDDLQAQRQLVPDLQHDSGAVRLPTPGDIARPGILGNGIGAAPLGSEEIAAQILPDQAHAVGTNSSQFSQVLRESAEMLTNVDRVVFAIYFLQKDGRMAISTQDIVAALKAAGCPDVRQLGLSYGQAAAQGLIEWETDSYRMTPLGSEWVEGWIGSIF